MEQFNIDLAQVSWTVAIPALGLSLGPLFWSSLADIYGRRIIFIMGTIIALVATIGAAVADGFKGYMATRFFQGFGVSPGATVGMAVSRLPTFPPSLKATDILTSNQSATSFSTMSEAKNLVCGCWLSIPVFSWAQ